MNTKHTPGPWKILKGRKGFLGKPESEWKDAWEVRAKEPQMFGGTTVFSLGKSFDIYNDQDEINATLIAAAPELLEALKELESLFDCYGEVKLNTRQKAWLKAAIAKAEGR